MKLKSAFAIVVGFSILCGIVAPAFAAEDDNEYNFSWLDPDKKIYVLQNRKYRKAKRVHLSLMGGSGIAETYRQTWQVEPRIGTWFNEDFGIEGFYSIRFNSPNNSYRALTNAIGTGGVSPLIREKNSLYGLLFNWAPWYAKINVFNTILYFDWYFSLGGGGVSSSVGKRTKAEDPNSWKEETLFAAFLGTGQMFHLSESVDMRLEFMGHFYSADIYGGSATTGAQTSIYSNFTVNLGIGVKL